MMTLPSAQSFRIGIICALCVEFEAVTSMLDDRFGQDVRFGESIFTCGRISAHNVAVVALPSGSTGTISASTEVNQMRSKFPNIKYALMVGIGGSAPGPKRDIRLGDIAVSEPDARFGGVVQYDFGKTIHNGQFVLHGGTLNEPPRALLSAMLRLKAKHANVESGITEHVKAMMERCNKPGRFEAPSPATDGLYEAAYSHPRGQDTCEQCDTTMVIKREPRLGAGPVVHNGPIASRDQVIRDGITRDRWRDELGIICLEMEAAGLMDNLGSLVIQGSCDYADTHKNKAWQAFAAARAAAYAKALLHVLPPENR